MKTLGFLGMGNMAKAVSGGLIQKGVLAPENIFAYTPHPDKLAQTAQAQGFRPCATPEELVERSDAVLVAVKPYLVEEVLAPLKGLLKNKVLLSVAAGWDFARYETILDPSTRHLFIMPNTPAAIGAGVVQYCGQLATVEELDDFAALIAPAGLVDPVPESLMDAASAVSGCGPAFVYPYIEALADGGVMAGLPRKQAMEYAAQMVLGAAAMVLESGKHPEQLKDEVCSPGGSTIAGVAELERGGLRAAAMNAVLAAWRRSAELGK